MSHNHCVVGATDLFDRRFPVLRRAAEAAQSAHAEAIFVHDARAVALPDSDADVPFLEASRAGLRAAASMLRPDAAIVVRSEADPTDAILSVARGWMADLIVVGTHIDGPIRPEHGSVAADVVDRALRSVLVVPIGLRLHVPHGNASDA